VDAALKAAGIKLAAADLKQILKAVSWRVDTAPPVIARVHKPGKTKADPLRGLYEAAVDGKSAIVEYEPDADLRDTEQVPLLEDGGIEAFIRREVLPYTPDAWIKDDATRIGYEISFTRHFYKPQPLRTLEEISADILAIEKEAEGLLDGLAQGGRQAMKKKADPSARKPGPSALQSEQRRGLTAGTETPAVVDAAGLLSDLRSLIQSARQRIATVAYSTQTLLCWHVGRRLLNESLQGARAAYGKQILVTVSRELTAEYGRGFSYAEIARMIQFAQLFPDEAIVVTLSQQLSWSHIHALLPIKDPLARDFYAEMCRIERWDVRTLRQKIGGMLFERTALSKKPQAVIAAEIGKLRDGQMSPDIVFRDPYLLDLLGLKGAYSERDLESAILREIEGVLLELGSGFAFVARQKRISVGKDDFHLDLLFFHRHLRRLIAVELKLESFQPAMSGRWSCTCAGWTSTNALPARKPRSDSSSARPPTPSRSSCCSSMPNPSASASTSRSCRRCRCCASGCIRRSSTRARAPPGEMMDEEQP
jgi:predicted nuclease of restriction endonuclease-like (RecB) superfamily